MLLLISYSYSKIYKGKDLKKVRKIERMLPKYEQIYKEHTRNSDTGLFDLESSKIFCEEVETRLTLDHPELKEFVLMNIALNLIKDPKETLDFFDMDYSRLMEDFHGQMPPEIKNHYNMIRNFILQRVIGEDDGGMDLLTRDLKGVEGDSKGMLEGKARVFSERFYRYSEDIGKKIGPKEYCKRKRG